MKYLHHISLGICFVILALIGTGCIGPQWEEYEAKIDQALEDYKGGVITHQEFNQIREQEAENFRKEAAAAIKEQTQGPITGNPAIDALIGIAGTVAAGMYGLNRHRDKMRVLRGEAVNTPVNPS